MVAEGDGDQEDFPSAFQVAPDGLLDLLAATGGNGSRTDGTGGPTPAPDQAMEVGSAFVLVEPPGYLHIGLEFGPDRISVGSSSEQEADGPPAVETDPALRKQIPGSELEEGWADSRQGKDSEERPGPPACPVPPKNRLGRLSGGWLLWLRFVRPGGACPGGQHAGSALRSSLDTGVSTGVSREGGGCFRGGVASCRLRAPSSVHSGFRAGCSVEGDPLLSLISANPTIPL